MEFEKLMMTETTPTEEATAEVENEVDSTPKEETENETESQENTETQEVSSEPVQELFQIRYKHKDLDIPKEEAKRLAQMGKHYEENAKSLLDSLDYVATIQGKSVKELIDGLVNGVESARKEELIAELGADNPLVEELLENFRQKNNKAYEAVKAERATKERQEAEEVEKSISTKLAEQFEGVRALFPEYDTIEKIPDVVIKGAIKNGDLEKEMLRYQLTEQRKVEAEKASQEKNKKENIGSVNTSENEDGIASAFIKGIWG